MGLRIQPHAQSDTMTVARGSGMWKEDANHLVVTTFPTYLDKGNRQRVYEIEEWSWTHSFKYATSLDGSN